MNMACFAQKIRGMTIVEMMVAIAVVLIAMEGFTFLFLRTWDTNKFIIEEGLASMTASRATNKIVIQLRGVQQADNGDYPLESGDDFDIVFYNNVDGDVAVERVHYFLDQVNDQLKIGVTNPLATNPVTYPAGDTTVSVVADYIVNDATDPIFYYYNENYPTDIVNNPIATPAVIGEVQMIRVKLYVNINPIHAPDNINIESFVDLRNLHSL